MYCQYNYFVLKIFFNSKKSMLLPFHLLKLYSKRTIFMQLFKTLSTHSYYLRSSHSEDKTSFKEVSENAVQMSPLKKQKCSDDTLQKKEAKPIMTSSFQKLLQLFHRLFS